VVSSSLATVFVSRAAAGTEKEVARTTTTTTTMTTKHAVSMMSASSFEGAALDNKAEGAPITITHAGQSFMAYAPTKDLAAKKPMTVVYLHGVNGKVENGCPHFRSGASEVGWLVCPQGVQHGANGMASWGGDVFKQSVVVSQALKAAEDNGASAEPGVAVGFSQGSYVALDILKTNRGHFRGLVLIAAPEAHPSADKLHAAGVRRVVLAAGELDSAYSVLEADAKRLASEGMETRFVSLGHVGHTYATEDNAVLRDAITWAAN